MFTNRFPLSFSPTTKLLVVNMLSFADVVMVKTISNTHTILVTQPMVSVKSYRTVSLEVSKNTFKTPAVYTTCNDTVAHLRHQSLPQHVQGQNTVNISCCIRLIGVATYQFKIHSVQSLVCIGYFFSRAQ